MIFGSVCSGEDKLKLTLESQMSESEIHIICSNRFERLWMHIVRTEEEMIRQRLIQLGWTPPSNISPEEEKP